MALQEELPTKTIFIEKPVFKPAAEQRSSTGILIEGIGNLLTRMAKCCNPVPPQPIVGYITRDRGITIHKQDCSCILRLTESRSEQILNAKWSK